MAPLAARPSTAPPSSSGTADKRQPGNPPSLSNLAPDGRRARTRLDRLIDLCLNGTPEPEGTCP